MHKLTEIDDLDRMRGLKFNSRNEWGIPDLLPELQATSAEIAHLHQWGSRGRNKRIPNGTAIHFYTDDWRFNRALNDPRIIIAMGCEMVVEPNCSTSPDMPLAVALHKAYKKRWFSRYLQSHGVKIFVDLYVEPEFAHVNLIGVPDGWHAYFTRGHPDQTHLINLDLATAQHHADKTAVDFSVWSGGRGAKKEANRLAVNWYPKFTKGEQTG